MSEVRTIICDECHDPIHGDLGERAVDVTVNFGQPVGDYPTHRTAHLCRECTEVLVTSLPALAQYVGLSEASDGGG